MTAGARGEPVSDLPAAGYPTGPHDAPAGQGAGPVPAGSPPTQPAGPLDPLSGSPAVAPPSARPAGPAGLRRAHPASRQAGDAPSATPPRLRFGRAGRWLAAGLHALWRPWLRRRLGRPVVERIDGVELVVLPEVFNPAVFRTGALLARAVASLPEAAPAAPAGGRALDLGTGTGVGAVFAARRGWRVVATDVNPRAVRCARVNALIHGLERRIEVREGDLFAPVPGERFDLVLFNPPYFRGTPRDRLDRAWRSPDVPERFAAGLGAALAPGGRALVVLSTDGEGDALLAALAGRGLRAVPAARRGFANEVVTVWAVTAPRSVEPVEPGEPG